MQDFQKLLEESDLLFRGTNTYSFDYRKETSDFYFGFYDLVSKDQEVTSTSLSWIYAMEYAISSPGKVSIPSASPLFLGITPGKYLKQARPGGEFCNGGLEIEILGPIDFSDIEIIDSVERLRELVDPPERLIEHFQRFVLDALA